MYIYNIYVHMYVYVLYSYLYSTIETLQRCS